MKSEMSFTSIPKLTLVYSPNLTENWAGTGTEF
jgi:hypothetical protein